VFWVHADNETTFTHDYKIIGKRLGVAGSVDGTELLTAVRERIEADPCWLLILDNADNLEAFGVGRISPGGDQSDTEGHASLYDFVPRGPGGTVLWTSRDKRIGGSLVSARRAIHIGDMTEEEASALLETARGEAVSEQESQEAIALLAELDRLALAVSQAAAYMRRTSTPIGEYLSMLRRRKKRWEVLCEIEFDRHRRQHVSNSALQTWDISIEQIRQENPMAYDILHLLAFVDSQNITLDLIASAAKKMKRMPAENGKDMVARRASDENDSDSEGSNGDIRAAIVLLIDFSFLRLRALDDRRQAYEMHKLVQEATGYSLSRESRREDEKHFSEVALDTLTDLFPESRREVWEECERYVVHAQRAAEWAWLCDGAVKGAALLTQVSDYLHDQGRWREKEPVDERAYAIRKNALGEKHPDTILSKAALASTYFQQGRYEEAEKIKVEVLELRRGVLGEKHPDTIGSLALLATIYHAQGRYAAADKMFVEVLELRRRVLGEKHPDTIGSMALVAAAYNVQGRYKEAEKINIEVLELRRNVLGEKHPNTIKSIASLAATYYNQGKYEKAEKIMVEVLELRQEVLGENHPDTIGSMADLAATYHAQRRCEKAEKIQMKVLELRQKVLGEKHPNTIESKADLATTYHAQERYEEAEKIQTEVLRLRRKVLGDKHPHTIRSMADLVPTYHNERRFEEARRISVVVLELRREVLGEKHPDTLLAMHDLAFTWRSCQRYSEALAMMQDCFQQQCHILGSGHPATQRSLRLLNRWKADIKTSSAISGTFIWLTSRLGQSLGDVNRDILGK
jgi:tetratricopeptide (TPR) repeat protein